MLQLFLLLLSQPHIHECISDNIFKGFKVKTVRGEPTKTTLETTKQNIRIKYDLDQIDPSKGYTDKYKCSADGQEISWGSFSKDDIICTEKKVINAEQFEILSNAFKESIDFLQSAIKVDPYQSTITPEEAPGYGMPTKTDPIDDVDIFLTVCPRVYPEQSTTLASALYSHVLESTKRPIIGYVFINVENIPTVEKSDVYKLTYIHEIIHALGISSTAMKPENEGGIWKNPDTQDFYQSNDELFCSLNIGGVDRKYLITPNAHKYAKRHFGVDKFNNGVDECKSGIEIENSGGEGTAGSHPDLRTSYGDLMAGLSVSTTVPIERFTEVTMAMLMDTGFYEIDYSKGKPLVWGHPSTNRNYYLTDFVTGSPQKVFPYDHLLHMSGKTVSLHPSVDYSYYGTTLAIIETATITVDFVKNNMDWYNPRGDSWIGHEMADFQTIVVPSEQSSIYCGENEAALPNVTTKVCVKYECPENNSYIDLTYNSATFRCTKGGIQMSFSGVSGTCPSPRLMCPVLRYRSSSLIDPFDGTGPVIVPDDTVETDEGSGLISGGSSGGGTGGGTTGEGFLDNISGAVNGYYLYILLALCGVFMLTVLGNIISMIVKCVKRNKKKNR